MENKNLEHSKNKKMIKKNLIYIIFIWLAILTIGLIYGGIQLFSPESFEKRVNSFTAYLEVKANKGRVPKNMESDHIYGNKDAEITIFEYSDYECPFCKRYSGISEKIVDQSNGKVNLVYRHFNELHAPLSVFEANAAECAAEQGGDEVFFKYGNLIYKATNSNGRELKKTGKYGLDSSKLYEFANELNLNFSEFRICLDGARYTEKIKNDIQSGIELGVNGTPNIFIKNNKKEISKFIGGYVPIEIIEKAIKEIQEN